MSVYVGENERRRNRSLRRRRKKHYAEWDLIPVYINIPPKKKERRQEEEKREGAGGYKNISRAHLVAVCTVVCL